MRDAVRASGLALGALLGVGCASQPPVSTRSPLDQPPPLVLTLPSLPVSAGQTLLAAFADRELQLQCQLGVDVDGWHSVCVNPLGQRLLTLGVSSAGLVTAERGLGVPEQLDPQRVLADVQLAFWPLASLQSAYAGSPWRVLQPAPDTRRLWRDGKLFAEIHYATENPWNGRLWLVNLRYGYSLAIQSESAADPR